MVGYILCILMGMVGGMVGGFSGWLLRPGVWYGATPIAAAGVGFFLFFGATFAITAPGEYHYRRLKNTFQLPDKDRLKLMQLSSFDLYVTVHRAKNIRQPEIVDNALYADVQVGRMVDGVFKRTKNPTKTTCASVKGVFEECFHFIVSPTDDTINFGIYIQDIFAGEAFAKGDIHIMNDVLGQGFPQQKTVGLKGAGSTGGAPRGVHKDPDHLAGSLVVSFAPGANFPAWALSELEQQHQVAFEHLRTDQTRLLSRVQETGAYGAYGTWMTKGPTNTSPADF
jgi:hypothetical protein